ncbi:hypothetical protein ZIOFF_024714 [Zingiber officinale]|uniref:Retrovirus-related Pol polyprotein from transposon TNT 1-94-like beta-barrel domain-containing protein n=1 Tax=Zingiber officinale TaxID=94328 RepID=A0A8J5H0P0_ZINOF|nr:hypothetical protein ZIOFF_024714 [Zingiber officinale]
MNHPEEVLSEEGLLHGEEEMVILLTPIGTLKIKMMKIKNMDMEEVMVEAKIKAMDEVETLDGDTIKLNLNVVFPRRASDHMYGRKEFFTKFYKRLIGNITFEDLSQRPIKGKGEIVFELQNGKKIRPTSDCTSRLSRVICLPGYNGEP